MTGTSLNEVHRCTPVTSSQRSFGRSRVNIRNNDTQGRDSFQELRILECCVQALDKRQMKKLCLLLIGFVVTGCVQKRDLKTVPIKEPRTLLIYTLDTMMYERFKIKKRIEYFLTATENDSIKVFRYNASIDPRKDMSLKLRKRNKNLIWGPWTFLITDSTELIMNGRTEKFYLYRNIPQIIDGHFRLYFNNSYGVLGYGNSAEKFVYIGDEQSESPESVLSLIK